MTTPTPSTPPGGAPATPADTVSAEKVAEFLREARRQQNLPMAIAAGFAASLAGASAWAGITYATNYQVGWVAVGVGFLVGYAIRIAGRSFDKIFGYLGAALALFGCLLGNVLTVCAFVAKQESIDFVHLLTRITPTIAIEMIKTTFSPMDVLFYALALYCGYKYSFRCLTEADFARLAAPAS